MLGKWELSSLDCLHTSGLESPKKAQHIYFAWRNRRVCQKAGMILKVSHQLPPSNPIRGDLDEFMQVNVISLSRNDEKKIKSIFFGFSVRTLQTSPCAIWQIALVCLYFINLWSFIAILIASELWIKVRMLIFIFK